jgi:hypothetical protein
MKPSVHQAAAGQSDLQWHMLHDQFKDFVWQKPDT